MAITTYAELNTAVANWMARADLTSRIPEGIALAEAKMNRRLRVKEMVTIDGSFSISAFTASVPTNFGGVKAFWLNQNPREFLQFNPSATMLAMVDPAATGKPRYYNVQGAVFNFAPVPDATYTATLIYYLKVPALTASATTNWMITNHPDCYLYMVLAEMAALAKDKESADAWLNMGYAVMDEIKLASNRDTYGGDAALAARPG